LSSPGVCLSDLVHLHLPDLEDVALVRDRERHVGVLLDEDDGLRALVDLADDLEDCLHDLRRRRGG